MSHLNKKRQEFIDDVKNMTIEEILSSNDIDKTDCAIMFLVNYINKINDIPYKRYGYGLVYNEEFDKN
ncbi:MAG: hypothetical protein PHT02_01080 [Tissierellia bacterium]|nr:hypothetical protein [Tissierellia bacterium]